MTTSHTSQNEETPASQVFADPVTYLAGLGIESKLVTDTTFQAAA